MLYLNFNEETQHGTRDFPIAFYHVDISHPRYEMPFHWHKEFEIVRVVQGTFSLTLDHTVINASAGESVFIPGGSIHGGIPKDCIYECLVFDLDILFSHGDSCRSYLKKIKHREISVHPLITESSPAIQSVTHRLFCVFSNSVPGMELLVTGFLFELLGLIFSEKHYTPAPADKVNVYRQTKQLKSVFEYIENNYSSHITLQQLSHISGMSAKYFCRYFQTIAHKTPMDYLNYYRIERSCILLCTTDLPVTSIAYDCGFNDCSYYIKLFKRYKHTTPKQYQLQMKQQDEMA